jgi:ligand-binding sensor domain-containing protein
MNELIKQARELCWKASTEKANGNSVDSAALSWAIAHSIVPRLCDALEATTARAERAERERDAAVEDMVHDCSTCGCYEKCTDEWFKSDMNEDRCSCSDWQWRGQQAGKGETE